MVGRVVIRILFNRAVFEMHVGPILQMLSGSLDMDIGGEAKER